MNGNQYLRLRHNWSWNLGGGVAVENVGEGKEKKGGTIGEGGGGGGQSGLARVCCVLGNGGGKVGGLRERFCRHNCFQ